MKAYIFKFCLIFILYNSLSAQEKLSIIFAGDVMGHDTQISAARRSNGFEYDTTFSFVKPIIKSHDLAIGNLELTLGIQPYKGYPQFSSPPALAVALRDAGFDMVTTANNHSCDQSEEGVINTIKVLDTVGLKHTGTFESPSARKNSYPLKINCEGFNLGFLSYTYGTNSLSVDTPAMVNYLDDEEIIKNDIKKAQNMKLDHIFALPHWGKQYEDFPNSYQKKHAKSFKNKGVGSVIGSHPHVVQPIHHDISQNLLTTYSLGNFVSNQRTAPRDGGMMLRVELIKDSSNQVKISKAGYILTWVHTPKTNGQKYFFILPASYYEYHPEFFNNEYDYLKMKRYIEHARKLLNRHNHNADEYWWNPTDEKWIYSTAFWSDLSQLSGMGDFFFK